MADLKEHLKQLKLESQLARNSKDTVGNDTDNQPSETSAPETKPANLITLASQQPGTEIPKASAVKESTKQLPAQPPPQNRANTTVQPPPIPVIDLDSSSDSPVPIEVNMVQADNPVPVAGQAGDSNPAENCSICLQPVTSRAVLEPCCHEFDYDCIREWTNTRSHCPYCRIPTIAIMFNIQSDSVFDRQMVEHPHPQDVEFDSDDYDDEDLDSDDDETGESSAGSDDDHFSDYHADDDENAWETEEADTDWEDTDSDWATMSDDSGDDNGPNEHGL